MELCGQLLIKDIIVRKSPINGYGVFANEFIAAGEIIEECHVIIEKNIKGAFNNYTFTCDSHTGLCLGYGCIYNHSSTANADFNYDANKNLMLFKAKKDIQKGEEILVFYGEDWLSKRQLKDKTIKPTIIPLLKIFLKVSAVIGFMIYLTQVNFYDKWFF